jgi:Tfp pilus tip-associated adhesin PilY1
VPEGTDGWRLELRLPSGFEGEKVLAESRTFNNVVFFPTYLPEVRSGSCAPIGSNRVYAVNIDNGAPVLDINRDGQTTITDRYTDIAQGGIAPEVSFLFPRQLPGPTTPPPPGGPFPPGSGGRPVLCAVGLEILSGVCTSAGTPVRTYWRQTP